jgi:two-component system, NarL family, invasion response regulator UvrY
MTRIVIVDDHAIVREGLVRLLAALPDIELIEADTGEKSLAVVRQIRPQLIILDLNLPGLGGLELLRRLLRIDAALHVVVFSMHAEAIYVSRALEAGRAAMSARMPLPKSC